MAGRKPHVIHLRDQHRRDRKLPPGHVFAVCGMVCLARRTTVHGWKVTCDVCNPPIRRKVRIRPRPAPAGTDLESA